MYAHRHYDAAEIDKALRVLLNRDIRPVGEHVPEDTPYIAHATWLILTNRILIEEYLTRGWKP